MRGAFFLLLFGGALMSGQVSAQTSDAAAAIATEVVRDMEAGRFEEVRSLFTDEMKSALNIEALAKVQAQMEVAGKVKKFSEPKVTLEDGFTVATIRIDRVSASLEAVVALDGENKVAGLHYGQADSANE